MGSTLNDFDVFRGNIVAGGVSELIHSDDEYLRVIPGFTANSAEAPVWLEFFGSSVDPTFVYIESNAGTPNLTYTVESWNWNTNIYDKLGTQVEQYNTDQVASFALTNEHIDNNGKVRSRIGWRKTGFVLNFPWQVNIDQVVWQ